MSVLNLKKNFIFIHIPKTAGTTLEDVPWMGDLFSKHGTIEEIDLFAKNTLEIDIDRMFKFSFVRDPFTRFMSGVVNHVFNRDVSVNEVTAFIKGEDDFNRYVVLKEQHLFLTLPDGSFKMDFVGKFEDLHDDFDKVCKRLGEHPAQLGWKMGGRAVDYDQLYTEETREKVANFYKKDFELFYN